MTTKEYLNQVSRYDRMVKNKLSELSQLKELSYSISALSNEERIQTSPNFDKIGSSYCKIEKMEEDLDKIIDEYVDKKNTIIEQIDKMENEVSYGVLFARYIEKKTFERIATDMNYSFRNITRIHGKALQEFEKKYGYLYQGNVS